MPPNSADHIVLNQIKESHPNRVRQAGSNVKSEILGGLAVLKQFFCLRENWTAFDQPPILKWNLFFDMKRIGKEELAGGSHSSHSAHPPYSARPCGFAACFRGARRRPFILHHAPCIPHHASHIPHPIPRQYFPSRQKRPDTNGRIAAHKQTQGNTHGSKTKLHPNSLPKASQLWHNTNSQ
jgi:hypothetical protein